MEYKIPLLHIYSQEAWHDDAFIVGNTEGLKALRDAINQALKRQSNRSQSVSGPVSVSDGEYYTTVIVKIDTDWQEEEWRELAVPYTWEHAKERNEKAKHPHDYVDWGWRKPHE